MSSLSAIGESVWQTLVSSDPVGLFALSVVEAIFFPIPPDTVLIPLTLLNPGGALLYASLCTLGSALGASIGYYAGMKGGKPLIKKFVSEKKLWSVQGLFEKYGLWAVGIAGFTPVPYKVFTLSSGTFSVPFRSFILISILSRGARFYAEALLVEAMGEHVMGFLRDYFEISTIAAGVVFILGYFAYRRIARCFRSRRK